MATRSSRWKDKSNQFLKTLWTKLHHFFSNTSIHGLRYLSERLPLCEKLLWVVGITWSLVVCGYLIQKSWELRSMNPVFLAMDKTQQAVWEIPFPAVTVCPTQQIKWSDKNPRDFECAANLLCNSGSECHNTSKTIRFIEENSPKASDIFIYKDGKPRIYLGYVTEDLIVPQPVLTSDGICYSLNTLPGSVLFANTSFHRSRRYLGGHKAVQWSEAGGYSSRHYIGVYPHRALGPNPERGLLLVLKSSSEPLPEESCSYVQGFQVKVHSPTDVPNAAPGFYVGAETHTQISVSPRRTESDESIADYSPAQRQCYQHGEKTLSLFATYTQRNCQEECLANASLACCNCVAFYMPRNASTAVCYSPLEEDCLRHAHQRTLVGSSALEYAGECRNISVSCECLPACAQVEYESHVSQTAINGRQLKSVLIEHLDEVDKDSSYTVVEVFYLNSHFVPYRRIEQYGIIEFLSNIGGQLGLCLGMSALSVLELLYWLLVRPLWCCRSGRKAARAEAEAGAEEEPMPLEAS